MQHVWIIRLILLASIVSFKASAAANEPIYKTGYASIMALARLPVGKLRDDPDIAPWFATAYEEVASVGRAAGVVLPADAVEKTLNFNRNAPPQLMPSMAVDLLRGNRIELPWLSGKVVELGRKLGVPTPTHAFMYAALKPYVMGAPA